MESIFAFSLIMTLISSATVVAIVMFVVRGIVQRQRVRQETFRTLLDKGIYDYRLIGGRTGGGTHRTLGWGIFFIATGLGILAGLALNPDPMVPRMGAPGGLIPLFIGVGLLVFYFLVRRVQTSTEENGRPVSLPEGGSDVTVVTGERADRASVSGEGR